MKEYAYPFSADWTTEEVIAVITFFEAIETVYEKGIKREQLMNLYRRFKEIVPSKAEEKKYDREFEEVSGYSSYQVVKKMKEAVNDSIIKIQ